MMKQLAKLAGAAIGPVFAIGAMSAFAGDLSAAQILEKNAAMRGGVDAWQKLHSMVWVGHIESANVPGGNIPFVLEMERPNKTRFEIKAQQQTSVRVYDGTHGWKIRPTSGGAPDVQPYTQQELSTARDEEGLGRPLLDSGISPANVTVEGMDEVEGHQAYRLAIHMPSGVSRHVWIDATSFLDIKYDREAQNSFGQKGMVSVFYRDYRVDGGLQIPFVIETAGGASHASDRMVISRVVLNPPVDERAFAKPPVPLHRKMASVLAESPTAAGNNVRRRDPFLGSKLTPSLPLAPLGSGGAQ